MSAVTIAQGEFVDCPDCGGDGVQQAVSGIGSAAVYTETRCIPCGGTGLIDAERVRVCEDCQTSYWLELGGCVHRDLCPECGPLCTECARAAVEDLAADLFQERVDMR